LSILSGQDTSTTNELSLDRPYNTRTSFFDHDGCFWRPTDEEIFRMMLAYQAFDSGGLLQKPDPWTGKRIVSKHASPLTSKLVMLVEGDTLLDTIHLNLVTDKMLGKIPLGVPFWERSMKSKDDYESYLKTYFGCLMPLSRVLCLTEKDRLSISESLSVPKNDPGPWDANWHPMTAISVNKKGVKFPVQVKVGVELWRQLGSLLMMSLEGMKGKSLAMPWAFTRVGSETGKGKRVFLYVGGLRSGQSEILATVESVFCIDGRDPDFNSWLNKYVGKFKKADEWESRLLAAINTYAYKRGVGKDILLASMKERATLLYWSRMSLHRNKLWKEMDESGTGRWAKACEEEAIWSYDSVTSLNSTKGCEAYGEGMAVLMSALKKGVANNGGSDVAE
jgi:hypothetical protein